jgi:hypothetical protein
MITAHTRERIWNRLDGIVTESDAREFLRAAKHFTSGKHYIQVRQFGHVLWTDDSIGDCLVCVIIDGVVVTAMLSFVTQRWDDGEYWRLT